ncbi:cysteine-rich motor neuron 1 protein-like isoform X2 [Anopheles albimanus]|uniref:cysteine-rich motor neuron 1 protein-like isoform X2 n=1 Tax=Anopheles albimanus TaxID=7167 RepID=UPI00163FC860|nr:cysteine-rich motor neuron 1 protein-like isoform X2 [Anopheles albimanus]XP_035791912.1 cysteine-rich motor neuron 1 protein-like isoform X2 [Anopheles albimanus]XP_035791913.1 cysteine-rich motor neuron 1 protein-like isoform X2 [Anopheles albimanus]
MGEKMGKVLAAILALNGSISTINFSIKLLIYCLMVLNVKTFGLKCVCNPDECDIIRPEDCPGQGYIVWDPCKCCKVCARTVGEACGGPGGFSGTCEPPLSCVSKPPVGGSGVCMDVPASSYDGDRTDGPDTDCPDTVLIEPGCEIVNRKCKCWDRIRLCRSKAISKWDFKNMEECQLNIENLVKTELEFDEDYTAPPRISFESVSSHRQGGRRRKKLFQHFDFY